MPGGNTTNRVAPWVNIHPCDKTAHLELVAQDSGIGLGEGAQGDHRDGAALQAAPGCGAGGESHVEVQSTHLTANVQSIGWQAQCLIVEL